MRAQVLAKLDSNVVSAHTTLALIVLEFQQQKLAVVLDILSERHEHLQVSRRHIASHSHHHPAGEDMAEQILRR